MNRTLLVTVIALVAITFSTNANSHKLSRFNPTEIPLDTARLAELDRFWNEVSRTVREGDFEGYKAANHEDAVLVSTTGETKTSKFISAALSVWKQDFTNVKTGERRNNVEFRFSRRIGNETTAHEIGMFHFSSIDKNGKFVVDDFILFEALVVKRNGSWFLLMEYQKAKATEKEWNALK